MDISGGSVGFKGIPGGFMGIPCGPKRFQEVPVILRSVSGGSKRGVSEALKGSQGLTSGLVSRCLWGTSYY